MPHTKSQSGCSRVEAATVCVLKGSYFSLFLPARLTPYSKSTSRIDAACATA